VGTYTSIIHPDDGRELQIKCGHDACETYKVGDEVKWEVLKDYPREGYLLDDVYDSFEDDWVIIKDHKIHAVVPRTDNGYGDYQVLRERFGIQDLPDSEWTAEGWENKRKREAEWAKENEEFDKLTANLSPHEKLVRYMARHIIAQLARPSITRALLVDEKEIK